MVASAGPRACSRASLERVEYREFDGGHAVPPEIAREAIGRVAGG